MLEGLPGVHWQNMVFKFSGLLPLVLMILLLPGGSHNPLLLGAHVFPQADFLPKWMYLATRTTCPLCLSSQVSWACTGLLGNKYRPLFSIWMGCWILGIDHWSLEIAAMEVNLFLKRTSCPLSLLFIARYDRNPTMITEHQAYQPGMFLITRTKLPRPDEAFKGRNWWVCWSSKTELSSDP